MVINAFQYSCYCIMNKNSAFFFPQVRIWNQFKVLLVLLMNFFEDVAIVVVVVVIVINPAPLKGYEEEKLGRLII